MNAVCAHGRTRCAACSGRFLRSRRNIISRIRRRGRVLACTSGMTHCNVIVIGASAGGVASLTQLVRELPADLEAAVAVALHVPAESTSVLPAILTRERTL